MPAFNIVFMEHAREVKMAANLSTMFKAAAASTLLGLAGATLFAAPASAHYLTTRCNRNGDRCWVIRCDDDGDDCRAIREYAPVYDRWGYQRRGHWVCDDDGDPVPIGSGPRSVTGMGDWTAGQYMRPTTAIAMVMASRSIGGTDGCRGQIGRYLARFRGLREQRAIAGSLRLALTLSPWPSPWPLGWYDWAGPDTHGLGMDPLFQEINVLSDGVGHRSPPERLLGLTDTMDFSLARSLGHRGADDIGEDI